MQRVREIGVYGIIRDGAGRVLLVPGSDGSWRLPGAIVAHAEDPRKALRRGYAAETGLSLASAVPRDVRFDLSAADGVLRHHDRVIFDAVPVAGRPPSAPAEFVPAGSGAAGAGRVLAPWTAAALGIAEPQPPMAVPPAPPVDRSTVTRVQRFAAYGLVREPAGRILLTRIAPGYPGAGSWHLPGGGTDFGESAPAGLARELAEETGQAGRVGELLAVEHFHNPAAMGPERRAIDWHTVRTVFRVTVSDPGPPIVAELNGSTDAASWESIADARALKLNKLAKSLIDRYVV